MSWVGLGRGELPELYFPEQPRLLTFKRTWSSSPAATEEGAGTNDNVNMGNLTRGETEQISIQKLLETRVPSLFKEYKPSWWLPNGHMQTGYVVAGDFSKVDHIIYERCVSFLSIRLFVWVFG